MKPIKRHKNFDKNFKKRIAPNKKVADQSRQRLNLFMLGERGHPLNDHALRGNMKGKRSFSINADIRVIYVEEPDCYKFLDIGTHNQVYKWNQ